MMARADASERAEVLCHLAVAYEMRGMISDALDAAAEAKRLDRTVAQTMAGFAQEVMGGSVLVREWCPPEPLAALPANSSRSRRVVAVLVAAIVAMAGVGIYVWQRTGTPSNATAGFDVEQARRNVGLVLVTSTWIAADGSEARVCVGQGSCFAVGKNGLLLTNRHVTRSRESVPERLEAEGLLIGVRRDVGVLVCFGPEKKDQLPATIVHESPDFDAAILKVDRSFPRPFTLASEWKSGDDVYAVGFPGKALELSQGLDPSAIAERIAKTSHRDLDYSTVDFGPSDFEITVTRGIVSATRRIEKATWIQHDAVISAGSSGGPLLLRNGRLVGMNTLLHAQSEGFNLALDLRQLRAELKPYVALD